jgi:predicted DsbA family dithiol-disulfide isomerase
MTTGLTAPKRYAPNMGLNLGRRNMTKLEVFFDYSCPYCLKGHRNLLELLPQFPQMEIAWQPCEAHPRPERYGVHSDLLIMGMFFARENGADLFAYHAKAYEAVHNQRLDVENADVVCGCFSDMLNAEKLREALQTGRYRQNLRNANDYAYGQSGVWVVPAYRLGGRQLDSVENIGVSKEQLQRFLGQILAAV